MQGRCESVGDSLWFCVALTVCACRTCRAGTPRQIEHFQLRAGRAGGYVMDSGREFESLDAVVAHYRNEQLHTRLGNATVLTCVACVTCARMSCAL